MFIFLFLCCMITPAIMLVFGFLWLRNAPKKINWIYGYRTEWSMKSRGTWQYAHYCASRVWLSLGTPLLLGSVLALILNRETIVPAAMWVMGVQMFVLIASIAPVEWLIKNKYTPDGVVRPDRKPLFFFVKK